MADSIGVPQDALLLMQQASNPRYALESERPASPGTSPSSGCVRELCEYQRIRVHTTKRPVNGIKANDVQPLKAEAGRSTET